MPPRCSPSVYYPCTMASTNDESNHRCYASVCRLLQAKGIIRHSMICTKGRITCSGCNRELIRHRKAIQLEKEIQAIAVDNDKLAPLLQYRTKLMSIKAFRSALSFLPTFNSKTRDDYIFGAARYLANTLGILIQNTYEIHSYSRDVCFLY